MTARSTPASMTPFARLRDRTWQPAPTPTASRARRTRPPWRARSWPAHGVLLDTTAYTHPAAATHVQPGTGTSRCFSTPDTTPDAANARSNHDPDRPAGLGNQVRTLLPTPQAKLADAGPDYARAHRAGSGGDDLTTLTAKTLTATADKTLLPTPTARDCKGANQRGDRSCLTSALLPTPRASDSTKGSPHQHGSSGDLTLPSAVHLLPTPTSADARSSAVQTVRDSSRPIPAGSVTLTDAARLLPTPSVADALGGHRSRSGTRSTELLLPGVVESLIPAPPRRDADEDTTEAT